MLENLKALTREYQSMVLLENDENGFYFLLGFLKDQPDIEKILDSLDLEIHKLLTRSALFTEEEPFSVYYDQFFIEEENKDNLDDQKEVAYLGVLITHPKPLDEKNTLYQAFSSLLS